MLVLLPDAEQQSQYSKFLKGLEDSGVQLDVRGIKDSGLKLKEYDQWLYDHLAIMAPKAEGEWA